MLMNAIRALCAVCIHLVIIFILFSFLVFVSVTIFIRICRWSPPGIARAHIHTFELSSFTLHSNWIIHLYMWIYHNNVNMRFYSCILRKVNAFSFVQFIWNVPMVAFTLWRHPRWKCMCEYCLRSKGRNDQTKFLLHCKWIPIHIIIISFFFFVCNFVRRRSIDSY